MANFSHAHVSASASFSIWAYQLFVFERERDAYMPQVSSLLHVFVEGPLRVYSV